MSVIKQKMLENRCTALLAKLMGQVLRKNYFLTHPNN